MYKTINRLYVSQQIYINACTTHNNILNLWIIMAASDFFQIIANIPVKCDKRRWWFGQHCMPGTLLSKLSDSIYTAIPNTWLPQNFYKSSAVA